MACEKQTYTSGQMIEKIKMAAGEDNWVGGWDYQAIRNVMPYAPLKSLAPDFAFWLAHEAYAELKPAKGRNCYFICDMAVAYVQRWANRNGGGHFAFGQLSAQEVFGHPTSHVVNWFCSNAGRILLIDTPFVNRGQAKSMHALSPEEGKFFGLRM